MLLVGITWFLFGCCNASQFHMSWKEKVPQLIRSLATRNSKEHQERFIKHFLQCWEPGKNKETVLAECAQLGAKFDEEDVPGSASFVRSNIKRLSGLELILAGLFDEPNGRKASEEKS